MTPDSIDTFIHTLKTAYADDLSLAMQLADAADVITTARFGAMDLHVEQKPDHTPVTDADKATEARIREILKQTRPIDVVYGEELGKAESTGRRWILDPIDGTKNFVRGVPVWGTLIGLEVEGELVVGCVSAPMLKSRWFAGIGGGAWKCYDGGAPTQLHVSHVASLSDASISFSSFTGWRDAGIRDRVIELTDAVWRVRGFGDFWQYMLLAEGVIDIAAEPELDLYDMGALVRIVLEAGGSFTSRAGVTGPWGGNAVASNGLLHPKALRYLGI
ncbi:MAG: histidinol phosphatase [Bifidobacteriaceae bacterium]|jgi:histidinol-phosphatase|nr:histidinol phosphatase [Bifidobacteriaceae bacterium]MCI1915460.1 histidinol phosphatase [Bifidobacteriaceae bacterium]